jgi:hypothetical protein
LKIAVHNNSDLDFENEVKVVFTYVHIRVTRLAPMAGQLIFCNMISLNESYRKPSRISQDDHMTLKLSSNENMQKSSKHRNSDIYGRTGIYKN